MINHHSGSTKIKLIGMTFLYSFQEKKVYIVDLAEYFALSITALVIRKVFLNMDCQFCYSAKESTPKIC